MTATLAVTEAEHETALMDRAAGLAGIVALLLIVAFIVRRRRK